MEAKDKSSGFDFEGVYKEVKTNELIAYSIGDGRSVRVAFMTNEKQTQIVIDSEAENVNPIEMQRDGWQAILNNFKDYVESH